MAVFISVNNLFPFFKSFHSAASSSNIYFSSTPRAVLITCPPQVILEVLIDEYLLYFP